MADTLHTAFSDAEIAALPQRTGQKISLTALIDVVFILLMFFMLTSTFSHWQSLPLSSATTTTESSDAEPAVILLYQDGSVRLLTDKISPVIEDISTIPALANDRTLVISSEETTSLDAIVSLMQSLRQANITAPLGQPFSVPAGSESSIASQNMGVN